MTTLTITLLDDGSVHVAGYDHPDVARWLVTHQLELRISTVPVTQPAWVDPVFRFDDATPDHVCEGKSA